MGEELQNVKLGVEERLEKKEEYLELKSQLVELQENRATGLDSTKAVYNLLMESNKMVDKVLDPQTVSLDADLLVTASDILVKNVEAIDINNGPHSVEEYAEAIKRHLRIQCEEDLLDGKRWECLFKELIDDASSRSKTHSFIRQHIDSLNPAVPVTPAPKPRKCRQSDEEVPAAQAKKPENVRAARKEEDGIEESVGHMMGIIISEYRKSGNKAICFFSLVVNPDSFSATVENIFHFSFLVRDRMVDLITDDEGDLRVVPVLEKRSSDDSEGSQAIISITMPQWEELKKLYNIRKAMITPRQ